MTATCTLGPVVVDASADTDISGSRFLLPKIPSTPKPASTPRIPQALNGCTQEGRILYNYMESTRQPLNILYKPRILRIQPEIRGMVTDNMDLLSLLTWRATCKTNYYEVKASLKCSLTMLLNPFVPSPQTLLDIMSDHHAIFGGELALSFILRDTRFRPQDLEIFASHFDYEAVCNAMIDAPAINEKVVGRTEICNTTYLSLRRLVSVTQIIRMSNGRTILVHRSYTSSAAAPLTRSPCTALSNFVTPFGWGCSHPILTLSCRALLTDQELPFLSTTASAGIDRLLKIDFTMAVSPTAWTEFRRPSVVLEDTEAPPEVAYTEIAEDGEVLDPVDDHEVPKECWRDRYVCPSQGRYFGDPGSFVDFFDPLGGDEFHCIQNNIAPFGPMAVWRVTSTFDCEEGCDYFDEVLKEGVTSVPVLLKKDPFRELRDVVSDRYTGNLQHEDDVSVGRARAYSV